MKDINLKDYSDNMYCRDLDEIILVDQWDECCKLARKSTYYSLYEYFILIFGINYAQPVSY